MAFDQPDNVPHTIAGVKEMVREVGQSVILGLHIALAVVALGIIFASAEVKEYETEEGA